MRKARKRFGGSTVATIALVSGASDSIYTTSLPLLLMILTPRLAWLLKHRKKMHCTLLRGFHSNNIPPFFAKIKKKEEETMLGRWMMVL